MSGVSNGGGVSNTPREPDVSGRDHDSGYSAQAGQTAQVARPETSGGWPDKCHNCGAHWSNIGFDYALGFNCRKCGGAALSLPAQRRGR